MLPPDPRPRTERRRWPRRAVAWPVTILPEGSGPIAAHATDASLHGLRLQFDDPSYGELIYPGARCHIEVHLAGGQAHFVRTGEIRHVGDHGIGLQIDKPLPLDVEVGGSPTPAAIPPCSHEPTSITTLLRSVTSPLLHR